MHDLEVNFTKIAPFGKEDTAKELQDHAVENAEVAEIKRTVFRALTRLRAATIKEFDTIARLETQAIDAYTIGQPNTACSSDFKEGFCTDANWTCRPLNVARISGTFGKACAGLDRHMKTDSFAAT